MAAISFPSSPSNNQVHTVGSRSWQYNGTAWKLVPRTTDAVVEGSSNLYFTNARVAAAPAVTGLESRATAIESDITAIESAASTLAGRVTTAEGGLSSEITRATAAEAALGTRIDNVLSNVTPGSLDSLTEVVSAFQAADSNLNGAITSLASTASSGLAAETSAREAADSALDSRLTTAEGDITAIESAASTLAGRVTTAEGEIDTLQSDLDTAEASLSGHIAATNNPHSVTKAQVGLGNVDNTSDANKPVSSATQSALDGKQIKDVVSATAPSHAEGLRWVDSNDMTEYLSYNGAWVELDKQ
jgi:hypothetical protein